LGILYTGPANGLIFQGKPLASASRASTRSSSRISRNPIRAQTAQSLVNGVVTLTFASWNQLDGWLRQVDELRRAA